MSVQWNIYIKRLEILAKEDIKHGDLAEEELDDKGNE